MSARSVQALAARPGARAQRLSALLVVALLLGACATAPQIPSSSPPPLPAADAARMLAAVRRAGADNHSVLQIHPLRAAGVTALAAQARAAAEVGDYATAAQLFDQALAREPDAPDLLQDRAEMALAQGEWAAAGQFAASALRHGPRFGALCARGWQTLAEIAYAHGQTDQYTIDRQHVDTCRKPNPSGE
ncbi:MAG: tetratricopeptide repeat protein [Metallibacterium scheffleri]|nr:tetratricopeptide repeat protein [Metallibacterium scheffleri]